MKQKQYAQDFSADEESTFLPPYTPYPSANLQAHDPRTSSAQSLLPEDAPDGQHRRRLLLVYIHGFQGDETSFQSFPAHVHNLVKITLADTHTIHTKIYPKYKTRKAIDFPRDDFSTWLQPHESPNTDVILLGHSMGGLLAAEVVLLPPYSPATGQALRHRIVGTINFDVPFLGMHPGVIKSGLGSIFRSEDKSDDQEQNSQAAIDRASTMFRKPDDPNYNPSFANDVTIPVRKGWASTLHFINKHSDGLIRAGKQYVSSHLEFGGAMADYSGLKKRYNNIRSLEEDDEARRKAALNATRAVPRVRFVNYYTASSGRPKRPKSPQPGSSGRPSEVELQTLSLTSTQSLDASTTEPTHTRTRSKSPRISVDEHREHGVVPHSPQIDKSPLEDRTQISKPDTGLETRTPNLPPIPEIPKKPSVVQIENFSDPDELELAQRAYAREVRSYQRLLEDRDEAIKDREQFQAKLLRDAGPKAHATASSHGRDPGTSGPGTVVGPKLHHLDSESTASLQSSLRTTETDQASVHTASMREDPKKPKRDKKFCMLPPRDPQGNRDPAWVRVFMEGVDEVGAHCGLFFLGDTYEKLVGEVSARIESWVGEDMTRRYLASLNDG